MTIKYSKEWWALLDPMGLMDNNPYATVSSLTGQVGIPGGMGQPGHLDQGGLVWPTIAVTRPAEGATALPGAPLAGISPVPAVGTLTYASYSLPQYGFQAEDGGLNIPLATYSGGGSMTPRYAMGGPIAGAVIAVPIITRLLLAAIRAHKVTSLLTGASVVGTIWQLVGKSPKDYLEEQGFMEPDAVLGADFIEFIERALKEGLLTFPEVPRGYEEESFYAGLNYLHVNMKTGKMWLTDKVNVGRYNRWRD